MPYLCLLNVCVCLHAARAPLPVYTAPPSFQPGSEEHSFESRAEAVSLNVDPGVDPSLFIGRCRWVSLLGGTLLINILGFIYMGSAWFRCHMTPHARDMRPQEMQRQMYGEQLYVLAEFSETALNVAGLACMWSSAWPTEAVQLGEWGKMWRQQYVLLLYHQQRSYII